MPLKITVLGPESTGKSTLCEQLSQHYRTSWVPEHAREYLKKNGIQYSYNDLLIIAQQQLQLEDEYARNCNGPLLFIDTNMYVMKVWCEFVFGKCHQFILDQIAGRHYDLYLLCNIDLPWEFQEMREYPDLKSRKILFNMYKDLLVHQHVPWTLVSGENEKRLQSAVESVNRLLL